MVQRSVREAWVEMPDAEQFLAAVRGMSDARNPYDFGFFPAMGRLTMAHPRIGAKFAQLFGEIMFAEGKLSRAEREMVASVASAAQDCHY